MTIEHITPPLLIEAALEAAGPVFQKIHAMQPYIIEMTVMTGSLVLVMELARAGFFTPEQEQALSPIIELLAKGPQR